MSGRTELDAARDIINQQAQCIAQLERRVAEDRAGERLCLEAIAVLRAAAKSAAADASADPGVSEEAVAALASTRMFEPRTPGETPILEWLAAISRT